MHTVGNTNDSVPTNITITKLQGITGRGYQATLRSLPARGAPFGAPHSRRAANTHQVNPWGVMLTGYNYTLRGLKISGNVPKLWDMSQKTSGRRRAPYKQTPMRFRHWIGTSFSLGNIPDDPQTIKQLAFQLEMCPQTNRQHLQFFISFKNPRTLGGVKQYIGDIAAHLEPARNVQKAIEYCNKQETRIGVPYTRCDPTPDKAPEDFRELSVQCLWNEYPLWMLKNHAGVDKYFKLNQNRAQQRDRPRAIILWGPPGTGKSYSAREWLGPEYYVKPPGPFWIGYNGERGVLFDDYYSSEKYDDLLRWISENPISVSIKGSSLPLNATKFVFTTNLDPDKWHAKIEDKSALFRRIDKIYFCEMHAFNIEK